jgi:NAD(P)-dependent dehydrogenase (short-subunit alcohol dehydrogenase family)
MIGRYVQRVAHNLHAVTRNFKSTSGSVGLFPWSGTTREQLSALPSSPDQCYVVSSCSRGLGREFAIQLLQRTNAKVIGFARSLPSVADLVRQYPGRFTAIEMDLTNQDSVEKASKKLYEITARVDLLLNVSGLLGDGGSNDAGPERSLGGIDRDWLRKSLEVNVVGHVMVTQALERALDAKHRGSASKVVNVSARVGSIGDNGMGGWYSYRLSKAALNQFTKTSALELKRSNCLVLSIHPGTCDTDLSVPFQKNVKPDKLFPAWYGVSSMLDVVWGATMADTGRFVAYDGSAIPW